MFEAILFSPILSPLGLIGAVYAYPWKTRPLWPYLWIVGIFALPLLFMLGLQAAFTMPAGSCVQRPLNNLPFALDLIVLLSAAVLGVLMKGYRLFILGIAVLLAPPTLSWSLITVMSLSGCWI